MISQYSNPRDIDREFWQDYPKAMYWLKKTIQRCKHKWPLLDDLWEVENYKAKHKFSEPVYYTSPTTGNRWMTYVSSCMGADGELHAYCRALLYYYTEAYMTIMLPINLVDKDDETGETVNETQGVNVYTAHMFQRMADPERLGVDMSDRVRAIRNFAEFVATGWSDTRPPRKGEKHTQVMLRTPGSWIRGHTVRVKDRHVTIYRTFYADKSMSPKQLKDVRSFTKFVDEKMNNQSNDKRNGVRSKNYDGDASHERCQSNNRQPMDVAGVRDGLLLVPQPDQPILCGDARLWRRQD